jgi:uncharacterized protein (TIGR02421 family)
LHSYFASMTTTAEARSLAAIERAAPLLDRIGRETRLLDSLAWDSATERAFFAKHASALPEPTYDIDRSRASTAVADLEGFAMTLDVGDPIQRWLARVASSYAAANHLLLSVGTPRFHEISTEVYGGPRSRFDQRTDNQTLAKHLEERLLGEPPKVDEPTMDDETFVERLRERARVVGLPVEITLDPHVSAKALAGLHKVRVRKGARFREIEVEGLFVHEIETHSLTAQNGAAQKLLPFLKSGGPRTTRTQEGLAVFYEFFARVMPIERMRRIIRRVHLVDAAERGASFLDVYRLLVNEGTPERDAWFDAQRIFRGGLLEGGGPFTKDAAYLAGFAEVFDFLQVAVRGGGNVLIEVLISGRMALEDLSAMMRLRKLGVLSPPKYRPRWLSQWDSLLSSFAFTSFLGQIDLGEVEREHRAILDEALSIA